MSYAVSGRDITASMHRNSLFSLYRAVKFSAKLMGKALAKRIKCTILYATETGKSETFAKRVCQIFKHAFDAKVCFRQQVDFHIMCDTGLSNEGKVDHHPSVLRQNQRKIYMHSTVPNPNPTRASSSEGPSLSKCSYNLPSWRIRGLGQVQKTKLCFV